MSGGAMSNCEMITEMGELYATVKQLSIVTNELKAENEALKTNLEQTREWLFELNQLVAESLTQPPPSPDKKVDRQCP